MKRRLAPAIALAAMTLWTIYTREALADDASTQRRIDLIQTRLDQGETAARRWYFGWTAGFAAIVAVNATLTLTSHDPEARKETLLATVTSGMGLISTVALPPAAGFAPARLRAMPDRTPEERALKLKMAEKELEFAAWEEDFGHSWVPHIVTAIVNGTSFGIRLLVFRHKTLAFAALAPSLAIGEGKLLTMPSAAIDAQREYQRSTAALDRSGPGVLEMSFAW
jgi:hypothetical protein